jgi:PTH1 family peptidyl-tRNA hydrolase
MALDVLATRAHARGRLADDAWVAGARLGDEEVLLAKPLLYMNRSGGPVARLLAEAEAAPADLVVVVDDVALDLGTIRVRERGSHGGHNGLRSIGEALGTDDFARVRVGVRRGELPADDLAGFVLGEFPEEDLPLVVEAVGTAAEAVECLVREGAAAAMNRYNGRRP